MVSRTIFAACMLLAVASSGLARTLRTTEDVAPTTPNPGASLATAVGFHDVQKYLPDQQLSRYYSLSWETEADAASNAVAKPIDHKPLWPLDSTDYLGLAIGLFALLVAAGGGIGGGGVLVPLYILGMHFPESNAVALSNFTIMGGALANFVCNVSRKHPWADKPLIDWDLILVMEPATILGALIGGYINKLSPVWFVTTTMAALLAFMTQNLWSKGLKKWAAETMLIKALGVAGALSQSGASTSSLGGDKNEPLLGSADGVEGGEGVVDSAATQGEADADAEKLQKMLKDESKQVPLMKVLTLVGLFAWVLFSDTFKLQVACGSVSYWALSLSIIPLVLGLSYVYRYYLCGKYELKAKFDCVEENDVKWTPRNTVLYPLISSLAGVIAGLFGVGGGIVKGPLMLEMGVMPEVAAATSATMIMFTAGSASVVYISFGGLQWDYGIAMCLIGFFVTLFGQLMTYRVIAKMGRRSIIIFAMAVLMTCASSVMFYQTYNAFKHAIANPSDWLSFGAICDAE